MDRFELHLRLLRPDPRACGHRAAERLCGIRARAPNPRARAADRLAGGSGLPRHLRHLARRVENPERRNAFVRGAVGADPRRDLLLSGLRPHLSAQGLRARPACRLLRLAQMVRRDHAACRRDPHRLHVRWRYEDSLAHAPARFWLWQLPYKRRASAVLDRPHRGALQACEHHRAVHFDLPVRGALLDQRRPARMGDAHFDRPMAAQN